MQRETVWILSYKETSLQRKDLIRLKIYSFWFRNKVNLHNILFSLIWFLSFVSVFCCWLQRSQEGPRIRLIRWMFSTGILTDSTCWFHSAVGRTCKGQEHSFWGSGLWPTLTDFSICTQYSQSNQLQLKWQHLTSCGARGHQLAVEWQSEIYEWHHRCVLFYWGKKWSSDWCVLIQNWKWRNSNEYVVLYVQYL